MEHVSPQTQERPKIISKDTTPIDRVKLPAKEFLEEFTRDLVRHTGDRPAVIAGWAKHLEAREEAIRKEGVSNQDSSKEGDSESNQIEEN